MGRTEELLEELLNVEVELQDVQDLRIGFELYNVYRNKNDYLFRVVNYVSQYFEKWKRKRRNVATWDGGIII
ncbi:hypothetical protein HAX54_026604 [Datura stramonium]|uniref:Uncharacterized protein n=1 Tax=Datura stramonium TaxID=4076 RepID=A0ABS8S7Z4_DATST|nr:hypothetical protein [Datura stramonium]